MIKEDCELQNRIEHVGDDFTKRFKIVFIILSNIIFCGKSKSSYKINFYFKKKTKYVMLSEIELKVKSRIKNN